MAHAPVSANEPFICGECREKSWTSYCTRCSGFFCDDCWQVLRSHRREDREHQRISSGEYRVFGNILDPSNDARVRQEQFTLEHDALWFAISQREGSELEFEEYPRFSRLIQQDQQRYEQPTDSVCHPRLASFIGNSGAGKSALIRLLMEHPWSQTNGAFVVQSPLPVIGRPGSTVPTSGDVHLYRDPAPDPGHRAGERPLLFADCEGFHGGEQFPDSLRVARANDPTRDNPSDHAPSRSGHWPRLDFSWGAFTRSVKRAFTLPPALGKGRHSAIASLFPKLMYNFSDVVVHVNISAASRSLEEDIVQLLKWARESQTGAVNRATLPHLVFVLNMSNEDSEWDPVATTKMIFQEHGDVFKDEGGNEAMKAHKKWIEKLGGEVQNLEQLLGYFYASVQFIRIPRGQLHLSYQLQALRQMIRVTTADAQDRKSHANMLLSAVDQELFYQLAFDHFSTHVDKPFDFMEKLCAHLPSKAGMSSSFLIVMRQAFKQLTAPAATDPNGRKFAKMVAPAICSAVVLEMKRSNKNNIGTISDMLRVGEEASGNIYQAQIKDALSRFLDEVPCEFTDQDGKRCVNTLRCHGGSGANLHQDARGHTVGVGPWESSFMDEVQRHFIPSLNEEFDSLEEESRMQQGIQASQPVHLSCDSHVWRLHQRNIRVLFHTIPSLKLCSSFICFWCFQKGTREILPCRHGVCGTCLPLLGEPWSRDPRVVEIHECGLHHNPKVFSVPYRVLTLPSLIGRRILSFDGGGVCGIVELQTLAELGRTLGGRVPVVRFFDLVGGTSVGGIIALAIALGCWGQNDAIPKFKALCDVPGSLDDTATLEDRLKHIFQRHDKLLLSRTEDCDEYLITPCNVFVTTLVESQSKGAILSNYTGCQSEGYITEKRDDPSRMFKVWEAARATATALSCFKQYKHRSGWLCSDGGLFANNPSNVAVSEHKRLWPQSSRGHPDLLLSVGSGRPADGEELPAGFDKSSSATKFPRTDRYDGEITPSMERNLDAEDAWKRDFGDLADCESSRYIRVNAVLPPGMRTFNDVTAVNDGSLEFAASRHLQSEAGQRLVRKTADRMISTCFYFEPTSRLHEISSNELTISGDIRCRFIEGSVIMKSFGRIMEGLGDPKFQLSAGDLTHHWPITGEHLQGLTNDGAFCLKVSFRLSHGVEQFDITLHAERLGAPSSLSALPMLVETVYRALD